MLTECFAFQCIIVSDPGIHPSPIPLPYIRVIPYRPGLRTFKVFKLVRFDTTAIDGIHLRHSPSNNLAAAQVPKVANIRMSKQ